MVSVGVKTGLWIGALSCNSSCRPHPSLSKSIGIWRSNGRWNHADMLGLEDLVEDSGELLVIVVQQAVGLGPGFLQFPDNLPGLLSHPPAIRIAGDAGQVYTSCAQFDKEEHVNRSQPDRLHGEEVARQKLLLVVTDHLPPADGAKANWSGNDAVTGQDIVNGGDGDIETQLE